MATSPETGPPPGVERRAARYLFAIAVVSESGPGRVTTGAVHEYLDVTPASVTEMVSKLDDRGLVEHEKYRGVTLTARGRAVAAWAGWRFCVVSTFFESVLETTVDDETAFAMGVVLPRDGVDRLRDLVGSACLGRCPASDGDPERPVA